MDSDLGSLILLIYMKMIFRMINPRHIKESLINVKFFNSLPYAAFLVSNTDLYVLERFPLKKMATKDLKPLILQEINYSLNLHFLASLAKD